MLNRLPKKEPDVALNKAHKKSPSMYNQLLIGEKVCIDLLNAQLVFTTFAFRLPFALFQVIGIIKRPTKFTQTASFPRIP